MSDVPLLACLQPTSGTQTSGPPVISSGSAVISGMPDQLQDRNGEISDEAALARRPARLA